MFWLRQVIVLVAITVCTALPADHDHEPITLTNLRRLMLQRRQTPTFTGTPPLGTVPWRPAKTCKAIRDGWSLLPSGNYYIYYRQAGTKRTQVYKTYCQMTLGGHAWTFIPRAAVIEGDGNKAFLTQIRKENTEVLLVVHQPGRSHKQRYTRIRQLSEYSYIPIALFMNEHGQNPRPASVDMGPYLYLRVLPPTQAAEKTWRGFQSNGKDVKYNNCLGRSFNYWALYPNEKNVAPQKTINKHCNTNPCVAWLTGAPYMFGPQEVPNYCLFYAEMHFGQQGGCGTELVSDGSYQSFSLAIAVR